MNTARRILNSGEISIKKRLCWLQQTMICSSGPSPRYPLPRSPHKKRWFDWSAFLSTGVFFWIWSNMRAPSFRSVSTKLIFSLTCPYYSSFSPSVLLYIWGSPLTPLFPFLLLCLRLHQIFPTGALCCISAFSWNLPKNPFSFVQRFFWFNLTCVSPA